MSKKRKGKTHIHVDDDRQLSFQFAVDLTKDACSVSDRVRDLEPKQLSPQLSTVNGFEISAVTSRRV